MALSDSARPAGRHVSEDATVIVVGGTHATVVAGPFLPCAASESGGLEGPAVGHFGGATLVTVSDG